MSTAPAATEFLINMARAATASVGKPTGYSTAYIEASVALIDAVDNGRSYDAELAAVAELRQNARWLAPLPR